ncbi:MAG: D-alanine--D-alanine ligase [Phycisphaerales bacterium]|nr:MAG: D-alanine--D-alanine ligase [Phycisphaerales bacterium]
MNEPIPRIVVLMGGPDAEREVSLMSGREIAAGLREAGRFDVHEAVIDRPDAEELRAIIGEADAVFPALHGRWGEGGPLQVLLEALAVPYVGSRPKPAALAMNKMATKTMLAPDQVRTPRARLLEPGSPCDLEPPIVLKPVDDGSSVDLRMCHTHEAINAGRAELHPKRQYLLAEELITGREITVGIVLDEVLPLIEIQPKTTFYDYEAKYTRDDTAYVLYPELPEEVSRECQRVAETAYRRLGCRDVARIDFLIDERGPWFLEINTMPGFTTHSLVPMAAKAHGRPMPELCAALVENALKRGVSPGGPQRLPAATLV